MLGLRGGSDPGSSCRAPLGLEKNGTGLVVSSRKARRFSGGCQSTRQLTQSARRDKGARGRGDGTPTRPLTVNPSPAAGRGATLDCSAHEGVGVSVDRVKTDVCGLLAADSERVRRCL